MGTFKLKSTFASAVFVGCAVSVAQVVDSREKAATQINHYLAVLAPGTVVRPADVKPSQMRARAWSVGRSLGIKVPGGYLPLDISIGSKTGSLLSWMDWQEVAATEKQAPDRSKWKIQSEQAAWIEADKWVRFGHLDSKRWTKIAFSKSSLRSPSGPEKGNEKIFRMQYEEQVPGVIGAVNQVAVRLNASSGRLVSLVGTNDMKYVPPKRKITAQRAVAICRPLIAQQYQWWVVEHRDSYYKDILKWPGDKVVEMSTKLSLMVPKYADGDSNFNPKAVPLRVQSDTWRLCWLVGGRGWGAYIDAETGRPLEFMLVK